MIFLYFYYYFELLLQYKILICFRRFHKFINFAAWKYLFYEIGIWARPRGNKREYSRQTDWQTDGKIDRLNRQTDRQTEKQQTDKSLKYTRI